MHRSTPRAFISGLRLPSLIRRSAIGLLASSAMLVCAQQPVQGAGAGGNPNMSATPDRSVIIPAANRLPDANERMEMNEQQARKDKFEAANALRRKQIAADAAELLQLATELKAAVDKTNKDTLSIDVIRKADTIERLAKGVKQKMKLTVGAG